MHRIDTSTAQKDKFGAGKNGFTLGNAQTGVPPTEVSADILDAMQEEICAVVEASGLTLDKIKNSQLLSAIKKISASSRYFSAGNPLPTSDIGPIWHDDYADWMTWQTFNQNGANYTGYASRLIGSLLLDTQPTPRKGYIKSGVQNLSRETYAALRAWALHNGLIVAPGIWQAGTIQCADNADGATFRVFDVRGELLRAWDDGRGVDSGREFGSSQQDGIRGHNHGLIFDPTQTGLGSTSQASTVPTQTRGLLINHNIYPIVRTGIELLQSQHLGGSVTSVGGKETVPRNTAHLAAVKF